MRVSRDTHVAAPVERVFQLVTDPALRAELNPEATPLRVEADAPLHVGSVCHYRLQFGAHIVDYRMRVTELQPNRRLVSVSEDSDVRFEVAIELRPEADGTRLLQTERFEPSTGMLEAALPQGDGTLPGHVEQALLFLDEDRALSLRQRQEDALRAALEDKLDYWLSAIKAQVERSDEQL